MKFHVISAIGGLTIEWSVEVLTRLSHPHAQVDHGRDGVLREQRVERGLQLTKSPEAE